MAFCECGCGDPTGAGAFLPGHDQRLRTDLERRVGGLLPLRSLVEAVEALVEGELSAEQLEHRIRASMPASRS